MESSGLSLLERELEEFDKNGSWQIVYHRLRNEASLNHDFTVKVARSPENRSRNRYRDVSPYDHSRVILPSEENDYINASLVEAPEANRRYILTQGPLRNTSAHYWQMIWDQNVKGIVMLNRVIERGNLKCDQYWPLGSAVGHEDVMTFPEASIQVSYIDENEFSYYTIQKLEVEHLETKEKKEVLHFHYTTWPDFGVPQSPAAFLNFLMAVRRSGALENDVGPCVIHCSAGIGRSGTFCLVDTCLIMIEKTRDLNCIDIRKILLNMRKYRMGLIQTTDQLRFSYLAVLEGGKRILSSSLNSSFDEFDHEPPPKPPKRMLAVEESSSDGDDEDEEVIIMTESEEDDDDDDSVPPPIPPRTYLISQQPPSTVPPVPPRYDSLHVNEEEKKSLIEGEERVVQRRKKEEMTKNTEEQLERMKKARDRMNIPRRPKPKSWQTIYVGLGLTLSILMGGYMLYRYYI